MRLARIIPLCLAAMLFAATSGATAQVAQPTKVAIVNPSRIFADMLEIKALRLKLEERRKELAGKENQMRGNIEELMQKRVQYKPGSAPYRDMSEQIDMAKAQLQTWGMATKASVDRDQKQMLRDLYEKLESTVAEVAQKEGIDLVIADGRQDLNEFEDVSAEDFRRLLNSRAIIFSTKNIDITDKVLTLLDARFKQQGGGAAVPPPINTPAPK